MDSDLKVKERRAKARRSLHLLRRLRPARERRRTTTGNVVFIYKMTCIAFLHSSSALRHHRYTSLHQSSHPSSEASPSIIFLWSSESSSPSASWAPSSSQSPTSPIESTAVEPPSRFDWPSTLSPNLYHCRQQERERSNGEVGFAA
ncbi:unnamed protein product [Linum trigynum]|uniref:Uncharacterized protein n=1 Tax=Linum trigynum TaxID=586398 RepID=A0AAV2CJE4_9ROSI